MTDFRLPQQTHLGGVRLRVTHLDRALAFYQDILGLALVERSGGKAVLSARAEGPALVTLIELPGAVPKPPGTTGLFHVAIRVPQRADLGRLLRRLGEAGWPLHGASDHGVSEALYLADPDGSGLELYRDRPREQWAWQGDQVAMVTGWLDVRGLLAEADDSPWQGIAEGADIGHVHLSVSSLRQAEAFYADLLGFDVMQRSYPGALFMAAGGYHHHLGANVWGAPRLVPPPDDAVGLLDFEIVIPDAAAWQAAVERLEQGGAVRLPGSEPRAHFRDPDGIGVTLVRAG